MFISPIMEIVLRNEEIIEYFRRKIFKLLYTEILQNSVPIGGRVKKYFYKKKTELRQVVAELQCTQSKVHSL